MPSIHDPYLNTVKRTLEEERIKKRQQLSIENRSKKSKNNFIQRGFLSQDIYLPKHMDMILLSNLFIFIPYLVGLLIILFFSNQEIVNKYIGLDLYSFVLLWTVGYELIALSALTYIVKSAICFNRC